MPFITTKGYSRGNETWLDSRHGVENAKTGTLKIDQFDGDHVLSGTPVVQGTGDADGYYVPAPAGTAPTGFVVGDVSFKDASLDDVGAPAAILWHGRIKTQNLPVENFQVPAEPGQFSYVGGDKGTAPEEGA